MIDFVVLMEGMDKENMGHQRRAARMLQDWFGISAEPPIRVVSPSPSSVATAEKLAPDTESAASSMLATDQTNPPLAFTLKSLDPHHPYLVERGLRAETIAAFGCGFFAGKGMMSGRIAIPIHNEHGELVAYAGRAIGDPPDDAGKYKLPPKFYKSLVVFNLHRAQPLAKEQGLIVVEGYFDAMKVEQAGYPNVVALMGSAMSQTQEHLVVDAVGSSGKIALMFDEDEAGWKCREEVMERLIHRVYVKAVRLDEKGLQPDQMGEEDLRSRLG